MKHIVLAGGGHANALALRQLTGEPNLTLVSESDLAPYSGMLPGYIAGIYSRDQCFINLAQLAHRAGARFIRARIIGLTPGHTLLGDGTHLAHDILSLNTGAAPAHPQTPRACPVKPIAAFIAWLRHIETTPTLTDFAVIGGGAGGAETALALAHRWRATRIRLHLIARRLLPHAPPRLRAHIATRLSAAGIRLVTGTATTQSPHAIHLSDGKDLPIQAAAYATAVTAPDWFANTHLARDAAGFFRITHGLQSVNDSTIFVTGDAAAHPANLPKAGVMATRQGKHLPPLLLAAAGRTPPPRHPPRIGAQALYIIGDGNGKTATATRNGLTVSGAWVWRWKQHLDVTFMQKFPPPPPKN